MPQHSYLHLYASLQVSVRLHQAFLVVPDVGMSQYEGHRSLMHREGQALKPGPSDPIQKLQISLTRLCKTRQVCPDCRRV